MAAARISRGNSAHKGFCALCGGFGRTDDAVKMNILNVGYDSTNYYLVGPSNTRLLVDIGWSNTLPKFLSVLKRYDVPLKSIRYLLATHYHPDHAGLAQEL